MQIVNWPELLRFAEIEAGAVVRRPAPRVAVEAAEGKLGKFPALLGEFYGSCNGLMSGWFEVLPVEDSHQLKKTWDGLIRHNSVEKGLHFSWDPTVLSAYLVFASIGEGYCAVMDKETGRILTEDGQGLWETIMTLPYFIVASLLEAAHPGAGPEDLNVSDIVGRFLQA